MAGDDRRFPREEPSAAMRDFAKSMREMYVALVQAGFTSQEAMGVVAEVVRTTLNNLQAGGGTT